VKHKAIPASQLALTVQQAEIVGINKRKVKVGPRRSSTKRFGANRRHFSAPIDLEDGGIPTLEALDWVEGDGYQLHVRESETKMCTPAFIIDWEPRYRQDERGDATCDWSLVAGEADSSY
jgi:hypothetical protein